MRTLIALAALPAALLATGCIMGVGPLAIGFDGSQYRGTPPPEAPADGYRHLHPEDGSELVYDAGLGAYVAVDLPHHYYRDGRYLRIDGGRWLTSTHLDGPWEPLDARDVPPGLRARYRASSRR